MIPNQPKAASWRRPRGPLAPGHLAPGHLTEPRRILVLATAGLGLAAALIPLGQPGRAILVFWLVGVGPGLACLHLLGDLPRAAHAMLVVPISLAVAAIASTALALAHSFSPTALLVGLAAVSVTLVLIPGRSR